MFMHIAFTEKPSNVLGVHPHLHRSNVIITVPLRRECSFTQHHLLNVMPHLGSLHSGAMALFIMDLAYFLLEEN